MQRQRQKQYLQGIRRRVNKMADNIQATPRNYIGGLLTDAYKWMQSPQRTQQLQGFAGLLGTTGIPQTIERMAYGEPLTNIGRANVPLLKPETADALMTVAGIAPELKAAAKMLPKNIPVGMGIKPVVYPQEEALKLAQQRAALPVEKGGLGLPANNTAADRAAAMGFDLENPQYHATDVDFTSIRPSSRGKMGAGIYSSPDVQYAERYSAPQERRVLPLVSKGYYADADKRAAIFDQVRENAYANNPEITSKELHDLVSQEMQNRGYSGFDVDKERLTFSPEDLRSRFAAFDPFRRNAAIAAAMGVAAPNLLAEEVPTQRGLLAP
jgi:hypothetical protein